MGSSTHVVFVLFCCGPHPSFKQVHHCRQRLLQAPGQHAGAARWDWRSRLEKAAALTCIQSPPQSPPPQH